MAAVCDVCGKRPGFGHNVPWSKKKTNRRWNPNIQRIRVVRVRHPEAAERLHHASRLARSAADPQAWITTGMIMGRRRRVSLTHLPNCRLMTCCNR